jgi:hypothetical protein
MGVYPWFSFFIMKPGNQENFNLKAAVRLPQKVTKGA